MNLANIIKLLLIFKKLYFYWFINILEELSSHLYTDFSKNISYLLFAALSILFQDTLKTCYSFTFLSKLSNILTHLFYI